MWSYLVVFDDKLGSRDEVQEFLDSMDEVGHWFSCLSNCVFFTCSLPANSIARRIGEHFGDPKIRRYRFLVTEIHDDRQGWLPKKSWKLFGNPNFKSGEE